MSTCYIDTSALAKWYINEPGSEAFETFIRGIEVAVISRLTMTEMRCLLARRRRAEDFDADYEQEAYARFQFDAAAGRLVVHACADGHFVQAAHLIDRLDPIPLRTLDAIHLAIALASGAGAVATADAIMARAVARLRLQIHVFGSET